MFFALLYTCHYNKIILSYIIFSESVPDLSTARDNAVSSKSTVQHNMTIEKASLLNDSCHYANPQYPDELYTNPASRLTDTSTRNVPFAQYVN